MYFQIKAEKKWIIFTKKNKIMHIGLKIKDLRKRKKISVKEIAACLNVTDESIYSYERGKAEPRPTNIKKLAELFEVDINYLLEDAPTNDKYLQKASIKEMIDKMSDYFTRRLRIERSEWNKAVEEFFLVKIKMYSYIRFVA